MQPTIIPGKQFNDYRGILSFNNDFDASIIKRMYFIEHPETTIIRAWQGHQTEQRWFSVVSGQFEIKLIKIDDWEKPDPQLPIVTFQLQATEMDVLHVPPGYANSIQALEKHSKLLVMADYLIHECQDEFRFPIDYFNQRNN